ncbi:MAG: bifunctional ornithine acetyltransferase/N-acetylglutamate synthase [Robiginitomaculum sp.]|nr:MAG: bifunctional ornithine acetyltransferase/N-acetylglutamate synthase [Robiginitomaculum sp.]
MNLKRSPLAPDTFPVLPILTGLDMWVAETGMKYKNRPDVLLMRFAKTSAIASVFTTSSTPGAPVDWSKKCLDKHKEGSGHTTGLLVNAGNANVFTGQQGHEDVREMARLGAVTIGADIDDMFVCSTGVIGEPLDLGPFRQTLSENSLLNTQASWAQAAKAICTTDTYIKGASQTADIDGVGISICGIVKGSGMIAPDMATMLGFMFTDANISQAVLQELLSEYTRTSFNAISVDSDTSTSDTVMLIALGTAGHDLVTNVDDPKLDEFKTALQRVMLNLAHQVIKDGEGAQKFIEVCVTGAASDKAAKTIGMSIINSPLVKTAIAGEDANWGRVVMAVGKSGEQADRDKLRIAFGPHLVALEGARAPRYDEEIVSAYMKTQDLVLHVDIGVGEGAFTVWGCDLTHGYIDINADYRS